MESVDEVLRVLEHLDAISTQKALTWKKKVKTEKDSQGEDHPAERDLMECINDLNQLGAISRPSVASSLQWSPD